MTTQAEDYRFQHGKTEYVNGHMSEYLENTPEVEKHPHSNDLATGWIFPDGSVIWETVNGTTRSLYTMQ